MSWEVCSCIFRKKLIDGSHARGRLMRRRVKGQWQYRLLTPEEEAEHQDIYAW